MVVAQRKPCKVNMDHTATKSVSPFKVSIFKKGKL